MNDKDLLILAALLHDIGKFRQRATERYKPHQEHSYEFVTEDFTEFFAPCGNTFQDAILHHHRNPTQLQHLIEKQVILADKLSATEREDEERGSEDFVASALVSPLSRLIGAKQEYQYSLTELNLKIRDTVIPTESSDINQEVYKHLWKEFKKVFSTATAGKQYTPAHYQTIVALLRKYTSRIPSATPWEKSKEKTIPDISLYDHLRTTAAIAACIGNELPDETDVDALLPNPTDSDRKICALIKGDISGIQNFLYQILSDGASNQLRGRSFYLQLLTDAIANYVLKQFDLPITNLLLASGGHFFILVPYTEAKERLDTLRQTISQKLWELHRGDLSCILAGISVKACDFKSDNFSSKWEQVSGKVQERKQQKWSEMGPQDMFENLFQPYQDKVDQLPEEKKNHWQFGELGKTLRTPEYLITFDVPVSPTPELPTWRDAINTFDMDVCICGDVTDNISRPQQAENAVVYRIGDTNFLTDTALENFQLDDIPVSYDFRLFKPVIAHRHDRDEETIANYDYIANASEGVQWLGALRMDVDNLGTVFTEKLQNATISRLATLSEAFRLFFEGYVPQLCSEYNKKNGKDILELIYAGGDDLFLVGGWSALPEIAEQIRSEFHDFVTGNHVTLSGGIAIEHKKYPLYQFAAQSGDAEDAAKNYDGKNAITFLRKPMKWTEFAEVRDWHDKLLNALTEQKPLPRDILTRLSHIYSEKELKEHRWAWRSLYYFSRIQERYKTQQPFLDELRQALNHETDTQLRDLIQVITRWTALKIRK